LHFHGFSGDPTRPPVGALFGSCTTNAPNGWLSWCSFWRSVAGPLRQPGEFANVCYQRLRSAISFASLGPPGHVGRGWWVQIPPRPCPQPADSARSAGLLRRSWKARCRDLHHHCTKRSSSSCPKWRFGQSRVLQFLRPERPRLGMRGFRTTTQVHLRQRRFPPSRGRE
jgi:hypothetical protein